MISSANVVSIEIFPGPIHELSKTRGRPRSMSLVVAGFLGALSGCVAPSGYYPVVSAAVYQPPPPAGICGVYPYGSADYSTCMSVNYPGVKERDRTSRRDRDICPAAQLHASCKHGCSYPDRPAGWHEVPIDHHTHGRPKCRFEYDDDEHNLPLIGSGLQSRSICLSHAVNVR